jgi:hypothetical protein
MEYTVLQEVLIIGWISKNVDIPNPPDALYMLELLHKYETELRPELLAYSREASETVLPDQENHLRS